MTKEIESFWLGSITNDEAMALLPQLDVVNSDGNFIFDTTSKSEKPGLFSQLDSENSSGN